MQTTRPPPPFMGLGLLLYPFYRPVESEDPLGNINEPRLFLLQPTDFDSVLLNGGASVIETHSVDDSLGACYGFSNAANAIQFGLGYKVSYICRPWESVRDQFTLCSKRRCRMLTIKRIPNVRWSEQAVGPCWGWLGTF